MFSFNLSIGLFLLQAGKKKKKKMAKFQLVNLLWYPLIIGGMALTFIAAYSPANLPGILSWVVDLGKTYPELWPMVFKGACAIHVLEALFVFVKALMAGVPLGHSLCWGVQTLILGFASTKLFLQKLSASKKNE